MGGFGGTTTNTGAGNRSPPAATHLISLHYAKRGGTALLVEEIEAPLRG